MTLTAKLFLPLKVLAMAAGLTGWGEVQANQGDTYSVPVESFTIKSKNVDQTYEIDVYVPEACKKKRCSTLYFADSDMFFGMISGLMGPFGSIIGAGVPEQVVVGIGYPGNGNTSNWYVWRVRDLLDSPDNEMAYIRQRPYANPEMKNFGSGASDFRKFIDEELFPTIEKRYSVKPEDRTYFGYSAGSMFGLYLMSTKPEMFSRYVIGSAFWQSYLDRLQAYATSGKRIDAQLFFGVGLDEPIQGHFAGIEGLTPHVADYIKLATLLHEAQIPGLEFSYRAWSDETHATAWVPIFMHGMREVFLGGCKPYAWSEGKCPDNGK